MPMMDHSFAHKTLSAFIYTNIAFNRWMSHCCLYQLPDLDSNQQLAGAVIFIIFTPMEGYARYIMYKHCHVYLDTNDYIVVHIVGSVYVVAFILGQL